MPGIVLAACLACLQDPGDASGWKIETRTGAWLPEGRTRVREGASVPAWMELRDQLGLQLGFSGEIAVVREARDLDWRFSIGVLQSTGRDRHGADFAFDEGPFVADLPFTTRLVFGRVTAGLEWKRILLDDGASRLGLSAELVYDRGFMGIHQPGSPRGGSTENYNQFLPYPRIGVVRSLPVSETGTLEIRARAAWVPDLATPYFEGGRLYMNIRDAGGDLTMSWKLSPSVRLGVGAGYEYWRGLLRSHEDGNQLVLEGFRFDAALDISF